MTTLLVIAGAALLVLGIALIPLPGPGLLIALPGAVVLTLGVVMSRSRRGASG